MTRPVVPTYCITGSDYLTTRRSLPAIAAHLANIVGELRDAGEFPRHASVHIEVGDDSILDIRVEGLSPANDPDRVDTMSALHTLFEVASHANLIDITGEYPALFTHRILAVDAAGIPYAGVIGAGIGEIHPVAAAWEEARASRPPRPG